MYIFKEEIGRFKNLWRLPFCCYASTMRDNSKTSSSDRNSLQNAKINVSEKFKKWESKCFLYDKNIIDDSFYGYFCRLKFCFTIQYFSFSAFDFAAA